MQKCGKLPQARLHLRSVAILVAGRFILWTVHHKARRTISGWCDSYRYCSLQSYDISRPNVYICEMDDNNDTQHMNTEVGVTKRGEAQIPLRRLSPKLFRGESCGHKSWKSRTQTISTCRDVCDKVRDKSAYIIWQCVSGLKNSWEGSTPWQFKNSRTIKTDS